MKNHAVHNTPSAASPPATEVTSFTLREDLLNDSEDVGIPPDGVWDHNAVYDHRFCFHHGQREWLLGTPDRWMRPSDFKISEAGTKLESKLEKYRQTSSEFQPHSRKFQAECNRRLWSHMDVPIKRRALKDKVMYLIRWKACWTPESNINDMEWVLTSYEANKNLGCRRSARLRSTTEIRTEKNKAIKLVVKLEDHL